MPAFQVSATCRVLLMLLLCVSGGRTVAQNPSSDRVGELAAGIQAAESIRAIKRVQNARAHYLDQGQWDDVADLYTSDATIERGDDTLASGRDEFANHFRQAAGGSRSGLAPDQLNARLVMQPIVTLGPDGTTASASWHEVALLGHFGEYARWEGGVYENEYLLEDGVWAISRERFFPQYQGDYSEDGHHAPASWGIPYHFSADDVGITIPDAALDALKPKALPVRTDELVAELAARAARLEAENAIRNLHNIYGYYLDRKMWDDVTDLFTEDGEFRIASRGTYRSPERIRLALEDLYGPAPLVYGELFDHIQLATVVTLTPDGTGAAVRSFELAQLGQTGEYARWELGIYENEMILEDGAWKIRSLNFYPRMTTDYDDGWATSTLQIPAPSESLPPDRSARGTYSAYPQAQAVAIHFDKPGSKRASRLRVRKTANPAQTLADAEAALRRAIGVDATENLMSAYGYFIDESDWNGMSDTYASTGSKEITGVGVYVGPERIRTILNLRGPRDGRSPTFFTIHQLTQPVIHIAEDGQSANARVRLYQSGGSADGSSGSWIGGIYENTAVFENGEWKFGRQDLHHSFNASYRNGWARVGGASLPGDEVSDSPRAVRGGGIRQGLGGAASPGSFAADFPPDGEIRAQQYTFPEISEPAFHYANPVSGREPPERMPD